MIENKQKLGHCATETWGKKAVIEEKTVYIPNNDFINGNLTEGFFDEEFKHETYGTLTFTVNTKMDDLKDRHFFTLYVKPNTTDWSDYQRFMTWVYVEATNHRSFYLHYEIKNQEKDIIHAVSVEPNKWVPVYFEFDVSPRKKIDTILLGLLNLGCPPEAEPLVKIHFGEIVLQKLIPDNVLGWYLHDQLAYNHVGYGTNDRKLVITNDFAGEYFQLIDQNNNIVLTKNVEKINNLNNWFYLCDFSEFTINGYYYLSYGKLKTELFMIGNGYLHSSIEKSIVFLSSLRCGEDVKGIHSPCHLTSYTLHPVNKSRVPNFGGWHDAGDVSQFEIPTAEMTHALLDLYESTDKSIYKDLRKELLQEARVGLNWLLRTRFGDGMRALAVTYSIWRGNVLADNALDMRPGIAEEGAFENLLAASSEAQGALSFMKNDLIMARWCKNAAMADYDFAIKEIEQDIYTKRWGKIPPSQLYGELVLASILLYQLTNETKYLDKAVSSARIVMACQQTKDPNWDIKIKGFFYEDPEHTKNLVFEHRGHYDAPIYGLTKLYELCPKHEDAPLWKNCLILFGEYIKSICKYTYPYEVLPAGIYETSKINLNSYTIPTRITKEEATEYLIKQIEQGIKLAEGVYLRRMGVAVQRRGYHATMLSMAKAVSSVSAVLNDNELKEIAQKQIAWILGNNPFASSTMYGEGYHYHPLYVAFSNQIEGALPVGIKTYENRDEPYWPTRINAVYKEIWGHTTGKYLWVLADIIKMNNK